MTALVARGAPGANTPADTSTTSAPGQSVPVAAARLRAGDRLLLDGYAREVVRIETVATPNQSEKVDKAEDQPRGEIGIRVCFLNGSSRIVPHNHAFEVTHHTDNAGADDLDEQPDRPSDGLRSP